MVHIDNARRFQKVICLVCVCMSVWCVLVYKGLGWGGGGGVCVFVYGECDFILLVSSFNLPPSFGSLSFHFRPGTEFRVINPLK